MSLANKMCMIHRWWGVIVLLCTWVLIYERFYMKMYSIFYFMLVKIQYFLRSMLVAAHLDVSIQKKKNRYI
jgi:hypothetical protein